MFLIYSPSQYDKEITYILNVIFHEFWGIDYQLITENRNSVCIKLQNDSNPERHLQCADNLFQTAQEDWLMPCSLPIQPLPVWVINDQELKNRLGDHSIPVIYGEKLENGDFVKVADNEVMLGIDIFGSAFFMITRYEEVVNNERDEHNRFYAKASLAYQEGFLERPIINEYLEILWWCIQRLWPNTKRKSRKFSVFPTHDVDHPFAQVFATKGRLCRQMAGDIFKRHDMSRLINRVKATYHIKTGNFRKDEYYTFEKIMDISEKNNLVSCFYFKPDHLNAKFDDFYPLEHPYIKALMKNIHMRGHKIGLHPGYDSYNNGKQIRREYEQLVKVCESLGIYQSIFGGRQHYLRWQNPDTWQHYENAGIACDSTLSFADHIGFRCGVCYEYPVFNVKTRQPLKLREKPLTVMECSALEYMNLSYYAAYEKMVKLKQVCKQYQGEFVFLWHNSTLTDKRDIELYIKAITEE